MGMHFCSSNQATVSRVILRLEDQSNFVATANNCDWFEGFYSFLKSLNFELAGNMQDDSCTWSPEQLQMAVGGPPLQDYSTQQPEGETLTRAESAGSPGAPSTPPHTPPPRPPPL